MAKKGLSKEILDSIKEMSINGVLPQDVASALNIAVSTVHHHKAVMKNNGITFPDFRGQRPVKDDKSASNESGVFPSLVVNGTKIFITGEPLLIRVGPDSIEVEYKK